MTTVKELIERLKSLPEDAEVRVVNSKESKGDWYSHNDVCHKDFDLDKDIFVEDHRDVDPVKFPSIGGKCWIDLGTID